MAPGPGSTIMEEGHEDNRIAASASSTSTTTSAPGTPRPVHSQVGENGRFWVFGGADRGGGNATFSIPCVGNATATVLGGGTAPSGSAGSFADGFSDRNAVHIPTGSPAARLRPDLAREGAGRAQCARSAHVPS